MAEDETHFNICVAVSVAVLVQILVVECYIHTVVDLLSILSLITTDDFITLDKSAQSK